MRDSREMRKILATFLAAGLGAVVANKLLQPKVEKALKVRKK